MLRGWIEDEGELMELCERWSFTASLQYLTLQTFICCTQPSTYKWIRAHFFCGLSEEISQAVAEQLWQEKWPELHGIVYSVPGCSDAWNDKSVPMAARLKVWWVSWWWCSDMILMFGINNTAQRKPPRASHMGYYMHINYMLTVCLSNNQLCIHTVTV